MNHGGDTPFKREMCGRLGRPIRMFGWLGGARGWHLWQRGEAAWLGLRPALVRWRRRLGLPSNVPGAARALIAFLTWRLADATVWS